MAIHLLLMNKYENQLIFLIEYSMEICQDDVSLIPLVTNTHNVYLLLILGALPQ